jgi:hypothetical protein
MCSPVLCCLPQATWSFTNDAKITGLDYFEDERGLMTLAMAHNKGSISIFKRALA